MASIQQTLRRPIPHTNHQRLHWKLLALNSSWIRLFVCTTFQPTPCRGPELETDICRTLTADPIPIDITIIFLGRLRGKRQFVVESPPYNST